MSSKQLEEVGVHACRLEGRVDVIDSRLDFFLAQSSTESGHTSTTVNDLVDRDLWVWHVGVDVDEVRAPGADAVSAMAACAVRLVDFLAVYRGRLDSFFFDWSFLSFFFSRRFFGLFGLLYLSNVWSCLLYTSPSPRDGLLSRMPSSA